MIDLRSDTVTKPTPGMLDAICSAKLGDDVYGDDETTNDLEHYCSELLKKESAVFFPSGTQANLAAVLSHCQRGEEYLIGETYHILNYEASGTSVLGGTSACPLPVDERGAICVESIDSRIKPDDYHFPVTSMISLENTVKGIPQALEATRPVIDLAHRRGLKVHLDGARLFNASISLHKSPAILVESCDTVSICLSKGLGAPAGTVLTGSDYLISKARRMRKMLGGGLRQTGILAAAGLFALKKNIKRLTDDHKRAKILAEECRALDLIKVHDRYPTTNMVFISLLTDNEITHNKFASELKKKNILISTPTKGPIRLVFHLGVSDLDLEKVIDSIKGALKTIR